MAPLDGNSVGIEVETAPAVFTDLGEGTAYDASSSNSVTTTNTFGGGKRRTSQDGDSTYSVTALLDPTDPAQLALLAAERNRTVINIHVMPDGLKGFKVPIRVTSKRHSARAEPGFQEITFDMTEDGAPVADGAGGYII